MSLSRIQERVVKGGQDVPESMVRRRFHRSIGNFFREYQQLLDWWYLFDNTGTKPVTIAFKKATKLRMMKHEMYESLVARYGEK